MPEIVGASSSCDAAEAEEKRTRLTEIQKVPNSSRDSIRNEYRKALATYTGTCHFLMKPSCLSPLTLAAFGWEAVEKDRLRCSKCSTEWCILFPATLSASVSKVMAQKYEPQMATKHSVACSFRKPATDYLNNTVQEKDVIPTSLAWVWDADEVELAEHPAPLQLLQSRAKEIACPEEFKVELPMELQEYEVDGVKGEDLLSTVADRLSVGRGSALLALFGWRRCVGNEEGLENATLECKFCNSTYCIGGPDPQLTSEGDEPALPERKRRKLSSNSNPLTAHRHYCPYACGLVRANETFVFPPVWKTLANRVLRQANEASPGLVSAADIRKLLLQGIGKNRNVPVRAVELSS